jgi:serine/threonine protein phosphatase PrpC
VIATPEIQTFKLRESTHDFIVIASDGIFDRMNTEEVIHTIWTLS